MQVILDFFRETVILGWLQGDLILELFNQYFLSQSPSNQVLIIIGLSILVVLGAIKVVKATLKLAVTWVKVIVLLGLAYYLFVIVLGIDIWSIFNL